MTACLFLCLHGLYLIFVYWTVLAQSLFKKFLMQVFFITADKEFMLNLLYTIKSKLFIQALLSSTLDQYNYDKEFL